ncbi:MAG: hypothetical protein KF723_00530 [Rhizobiaceae bacterium]|nr:hypothetical protein [Rhizobiaceae bacterium]
MRRFALYALSAIVLAATAPAAHTGEWFFPTSNKVSRACDDRVVLRRVKRDFAYQVRHVPHLPDVKIVDFHNIHEHRYEPFDGDRQPIARRYCGATAQLSDGRLREMWYLIEDPMGFASIGDGVEFCVAGFDRWKVYNNHCRVLK